MDLLPLHTVEGIVRRFPLANRVQKAELYLKLLSFPWHRAAKQIPESARIIDVACGEGAWAHFLAVTGKERQVDGLELRRKVEIARNSDLEVRGKKVLRFYPVDLFRHEVPDPYDVLTVMNPIPASPKGRWPVLARRFAELVAVDGLLVVRRGALPPDLKAEECRVLLGQAGFDIEDSWVGPLFFWDGLLLGKRADRGPG